jgi:hypothetical protein
MKTSFSMLTAAKLAASARLLRIAFPAAGAYQLARTGARPYTSAHHAGVSRDACLLRACKLSARTAAASSALVLLF